MESARCFGEGNRFKHKFLTVGRDFLGIALTLFSLDQAFPSSSSSSPLHEVIETQMFIDLPLFLLAAVSLFIMCLGHGFGITADCQESKANDPDTSFLDYYTAFDPVSISPLASTECH
jgi:hypothetical protein